MLSRAKGNRYILFVILIFGVAYVLSILLIGCAKKQKPKAEEDQPQQQILTFSIGGFTTGGKKDWELEGKSANIEGDTIDLNTITLKSYKDSNNMVLTSDKGNFDRQKNKVHFYNNVVITNPDGLRMTTDKLDYSMQTKEITNDCFVKIIKGPMQVTGTGLYGQTDSKKAKLKEDITVNIDPATVITCKGPLEIDYEHNIAVFNKDVLAVDQRGQISADKADVYFNPQSKQIDKVVLTGSPKVVFFQKEEPDSSANVL